MKKLVVMLTLAVAVVSAHAAAVSWSVGATKELDGTVVYLLATTAGSGIGDYTDMSKFVAAAVSQATIAAGARGKYLTPVTVAEHNSITDAANFYFAIVAGDKKSFNYVEAVDMGASVYDPYGTDPSKSAYVGITATDILAGTKVNFGASGGGTIPEPTSGILLALGGAILALRRKRA